MSTILWVIGMMLLGILALTVFGMTITKKDMEDYEALSRFVDTCDKGDMDICFEEWHRLWRGGRVPIEEMEELRRRIIKKFK